MKHTANMIPVRLLALASACLLSLSGTAHAGAMAYSYLKVNNLTVNGQALSSVYDDVIIDDGTPPQSKSETSLGGAATTMGTQNGWDPADNNYIYSPAPDAAPVCQGSACPTNNAFTPPPSGIPMAYADAVIWDTGVVPTGVPSAEQAALVNLNTSVSTGTATSGNSMQWAIYGTGVTGGSITVAIDYSSLINMALDGSPSLNSKATTTQNLRITLTEYDPNNFYSFVEESWDIYDFVELTQNTVGTQTIDATCSITEIACQHTFNNNGLGLPDHWVYTLKLEMSSQSTANYTYQAPPPPPPSGVPEPATLALLGLGLLGLGLGRRKSA